MIKQLYFHKIRRICLKCGSPFLVKPSQLKVKGGGKYCSKKCLYLRTVASRICLYCGKSYKTSPSRNLKYCSSICQYKTATKKRVPNVICVNCGNWFFRQPSFSKLIKNNCCSHKCSDEYQSKHPHMDISKEKNPSWKGGITPEHRLQRTLPKYARWRTSVFERDNYTCQMCGKVGGKLNADHIKSFSQYPELRFDIDNGRTLCIQCHRRTDDYGWKGIK